MVQTVLINGGVAVDGSGIIPQDGVVTSPTASVSSRPMIVFENSCSDGLSRSLEITKELENGVYDPADTFEFYIYVEDNSGPLVPGDADGGFAGNGKLVPYRQGIYYLKDRDGNYYHKEDDASYRNNGKTPIACDRSGLNGAIAGVPAGYTIEIPGLIKGTDFLVAERNNLPSGYEYVKKELTADTYDAAQITSGANVTVAGADGLNPYSSADGCIAFGKDARVIITNRAVNELKVQKRWVNDGGVTAHGTVRAALYRKDADNALALVPGTVREITAGTDTVYNVGDPDCYVVREVTVTTDQSGAETITPVDAGGVITVAGENGGADSNDYLVSYQSGTTAAAEGKKTRTDVIANTMDVVPVILKKVGVDNNDSSRQAYDLAGAVFTVYTTLEGTTAAKSADGTPLQNLESGEDGVFFTGNLSPGTYYLYEAETPDGYYGLPGRVQLVVSKDDVTATKTWISGSAEGEAREVTSENITESGVTLKQYIVSLINRTGYVLPATGGTGTAWFCAIGLMLLAGSALMLLALKRRQAALAEVKRD